MKQYADYIKQIENVLEKTEFATLATISNGTINTRLMCLVNDGLKVYMQTDKTFHKVEQIQKNENVAINCGAFNFTGKAKILGSPKDNELFVEKFKAKHLKSYKQYTNLPSEVLIEINLTECTIWEKTITIVDFINKSIKQIAYDEMKI